MHEARERYTIGHFIVNEAISSVSRNGLSAVPCRGPDDCSDHCYRQCNLGEPQEAGATDEPYSSNTITIEA